MAIQTESSYIPARHSSGKRNFPLALKVARELGVVPSWPNLQAIRLAIESEAVLSSVSLEDAAAVLIRAGKEWTSGDPYSCPSPWETREISRLNTVDRFWFEDARWRSKFAYAEFAEQRRCEAPRC